MTILRPDLPNKGITANKSAKGADTTKAKSSEAKGKSSAAPKGDRVEISQAGHQMKSLEAAAKGLSDIREAKVQEMQQKVADGYHPEAHEVADAIIQTVLKYS